MRPGREHDTTALRTPTEILPALAAADAKGLRLQLVRAQDELQHVAAWYTEAHEYRLGNSRRRCKERVTDQVVEIDPGRAVP